MTTQPQYEIEERGATEATVRVTVGPEAFREQLDAVYRRYAREARIPGFRKGHIPRNVLESRFGKEAFVAETQEDLERQHLPEALMTLKLRPVSRPRVEVVSFGESDPFVFTASFAVLPEIDLPEYRGREVSVPPVELVTDDDVTRALAEVQSQFAKLEEKEGDVVIDGDIVRVKEGDREWDTRASADDPVTKGLIEARVGTEVSIDAELPGGKRIRTTLEVLGLREVILPEIDDEMAKDAGLASLDALKGDIEAKITDARLDRYNQLIESAVLEAIVEDAEISLPVSFVEDLVGEEVERIQDSFEEPQSTGTFDGFLTERGTSEEDLRSEIRTTVERRLKRELVLRRLAVDAEIRIEDDELEELAQADSEAAGEEQLRFVGRLKAEDRWDDYRSSKVNERIFKLLRESAVVTAAKDESAQGLVIDPTKSGSRQGLIIDPTKEGGGT